MNVDFVINMDDGLIYLVLITNSFPLEILQQHLLHPGHPLLVESRGPHVHVHGAWVLVVVVLALVLVLVLLLLLALLLLYVLVLIGLLLLLALLLL